MLSNILLTFYIYISTLFEPAFFDSYRLLETVIPKHYNLKILTSIEDERTYTGTLDIITQCQNATKNISLHRDWSIKFDRILLKEIDTPQNYKTMNEVPLEEILYSKKMGLLTILAKEELKENKYYLIHFEYRGNLSETPTGIFRGNYSSSSGKGYYAVAIFEPMGARRAFPCFDEPGMTATFKLAIGRKRKYNSTSNMLLLKSEPVDGREGWYWDHFMNSFPMSTYLVCFMIYDAAEFAWIGKLEDPIKTLARKSMGSSMNMVTKTIPKLFAHLQKYFKISFPFSKMDLIALPHAIGNIDSIATPGLVIIHEKLLFYEPFIMKQRDVQAILYDVAQKIVFQWISVVQVNWWTDVCIKTSLANYNTLHALNVLSESQSIEKDLADALLLFFHNVEGIRFPEELYADSVSVTANLNYIDYKKCGLLIRMAQYISGNTAISDITAQFLKKNSFQRVDQRDFWKVVEDFAPTDTFVKNVSLSDIMKTWTNKIGYPVVEVTRNYQLKTATLIQKSQLLNVDEKTSCWWVPITYAISSESKKFNKKVRGWLRCPNETLNVGSLPASDWLLLNLHLTSLYRVKYDAKNWKLLHSTLKEPLLYERIPRLNRMQLVDDLFEFTARGDLNLSLEFLLEFMEFLRFDQSYATWAALTKNMFILHWRLHSNKEALNLLDSYMQNLLRRHFHERKFYQKENLMLHVSFSALIMEASCFFSLPGCLKEVKVSFRKYQETKQPFHTDSPFSIDLRDIVFCYAIKHGGVNEFNFLLSDFTKSTNSFEREDMLRGLYCTQDTSLLKNIPTSRRVSRHVMQFEDQKYTPNKISDTTILPTQKSSDSGNENITPKGINRIGEVTVTTSFESLPSQEVSTNSLILATEEISPTSNSRVSEHTSDFPGSRQSFNPTVDPGIIGHTSNIPGSPDKPSPAKVSEGSADKGQGITSDGPDLEYIILHSKNEIVSDYFYRKIITIPLPKVLQYMWLFTERINHKRELDKFERFFEDHEQIFHDIAQQIKDRIDHVKQNLKWQEEKTNQVVTALRKNLRIIEDKKKSQSGRNYINNILVLFFILGILSIFIHS